MALLVVGPGPVAEGEVVQAVSELVPQFATDSRLDVLLFQEGPVDIIVEQVRSAWPGEVRQIGGAIYLAQVDDAVRHSIGEFVANARERLVSVAMSTGGHEWAKRFGSLWWKTGMSEKNSPADGSWWQLFRAAALRKLLLDHAYSICVVVGDADFVPIARQVVDRARVRFAAVERRGATFRWHRVLAIRAVGCAFLVFAILVAKWHHLRGSGQVRDRHRDAGASLLYSWFPRVWTNRLGGWKDMYHGDLVRQLRERMGVEPVLALRIYDRTKFVTPATYLRRIKLLSDPRRAPKRYVVLESFGRLLEVVRYYSNPRDAIRYLRMTRHPDFNRAFFWEGLDLTGLFEKRVWRSVLVDWPHLQALQNTAMRAAQHLQPSVAVVYCFEFTYGRALIEGTRRGAPAASIVGLQHGPITPMHLLYAGRASELVPSPSGGQPLPEPDAYALDGSLPARILERRGVSPERIRKTGAARFDDVWAETRRLQRLDRTRSDSRTRLLVAPGLHDASFVFGSALRALGQDHRLELVLKPHPKRSADVVSLRSGTQNGNGQDHRAAVTLVRDGSIYELMAQSGIFLGTYSSTSVEALAFGIPVILLVPNHMPDLSMFHGHPVSVLKASTADELRDHVDRLVGNPTFSAEYAAGLSSVLEDAFGPTDSQASLRLAEFCAELAAEHAATDKTVEIA